MPALADKLATYALCAVLSMFGCFLIVFVLYTVKSAIGIDLFDSPSFMHDFYLS